MSVEDVLGAYIDVDTSGNVYERWKAWLVRNAERVHREITRLEDFERSQKVNWLEEGF